MKFLVALLLLFCFFSTLNAKAARIRDGECEVCLNTVGKWTEQIKAEKIKKSVDIENFIRKTCKTYNKDSKERRLCYYIGGLEESASGFLRDVAQPLSNHLPAKAVCEKMKKKDGQVCELMPDKPIDVESMDLKKTRVKMLKKILSTWGEKCQGCTSKAEYIDKINEVKHKYAIKEEL